MLAWVARQRRFHTGSLGRPVYDGTLLDEDIVRAIELCALATREACMFFDLYGIAERTDS